MARLTPDPRKERNILCLQASAVFSVWRTGRGVKAGRACDRLGFWAICEGAGGPGKRLFYFSLNWSKAGMSFAGFDSGRVLIYAWMSVSCWSDSTLAENDGIWRVRGERT